MSDRMSDKEKEAWGLNFIKQGIACREAALCLELRFSIEQKDKLLDEMCLRHLRSTGEALINQGLNQLKFNRIDENNPEEVKKFYTETFGNGKA